MTTELNKKPEEIVVVGGGLAGCLTTLMLAKQRHEDGSAKYHVTIIEKNKALLNGASSVASRLHLGGEYPNSEQTAEDCLKGATLWKLIMPDDIYTKVDPMKFMLSKMTHDEGMKDPNHEDSLTLPKYAGAYNKIKQSYSSIMMRLKSHLGWSPEEAAEKLFGAPEEIVRPLTIEECEKYQGGKYPRPEDAIIGGFQTQERGLNTAKYLSRIACELEELKSQGRVRIMTGHEVGDYIAQDKKTPKGMVSGIDVKPGGGFIVRSSPDRKHVEEIHADQVIVSAWQKGPAITPVSNTHPPKAVKVHLRAMLQINLPKGFQHPGSAFIMKGRNGGMFSAYNDKTAICYIPQPWNGTDRGGAYLASCELTKENPHLPADWGKNWGDEVVTPELEQAWTRAYYGYLQKRFPFLQSVSFDQAQPKMVVRETLAYHERLEDRANVHATEVIASASLPNVGISQRQVAVQQQKIALGTELHVPVTEEHAGLFKLHPTKATYGVDAAMQTADMVLQRSERNKSQEGNAKNELVKAKTDLLGEILGASAEESKKNLEFFSLKNMKVPTPEFMRKFIKEHKDLDYDAILNDGHTGAVQSRRASTPKGRGRGGDGKITPPRPDANP